MADTFQWTSPVSGTFDAAGNWVDETNPGNVAFPGSLDTANLIGPGSGPAQFVAGPGDVATLPVGGPASNGTLSLFGGLVSAAGIGVGVGGAITLDVGTLESAGVLAVQGGGSIIGSGTIDATVTEPGSITAQGGILTLEQAKRDLLRRAAELGAATTGEADLRVVADGAAPAIVVAGRRWHVRLPAGARGVCLSSRIWVPAHMRPESVDTRPLGVAIERLWLDGRQASLDSPALHTGWHAAEAGWRWTDGGGALDVAGIRELVFDVAMTGTYWRDGASGTGASTRSAS
jgi:hypothetical protein